MCVTENGRTVVGSVHRFPCELTAKFQANNCGFLVSYQRPANASSPRLRNRRKVITVFLEFIIESSRKIFSAQRIESFRGMFQREDRAFPVR